MRTRDVGIPNADGRALLDAVPGCAWISRVDGAWIAVNHELASFLGTQEDELVGTGWQLFVDPDDRVQISSAWNLFARTPTTFEAHVRMRARDGTFRDVQLRARPRTDGMGQVVGHLGLVTEVAGPQVDDRVVAADIGQSKRSEAAARTSEEQLFDANSTLEAFFAAAPGILSLYDEELRFLNTDATTAAYFGLDRQTIKGRRLADCDPLVGARIEPLMRRVIETNQPALDLEISTPILSRGGEMGWFRASYFPVPLRSGRRGLGALATDITHLKRAEQALQASESRLRLLIEHTPASVAMFDREMRYIAVSRRFLTDQRIQGDVIGRCHYDVLPEVPERWKEIHRRCLAGAVESADEDPFPRADGIMDWTRWEIHPWRTEDGQIGGIILFAELITERKHALEVIRESEERFHTLADNIAQLAWMADETGAVFWYNQRWYDYTGTTLDEVAGWGWRKVLHPDYVERVVAKLRRCFDTGDPWEDTFPLRGRDGNCRWFLSRAIAIRNEGGKIVRWLGTNTDITAQRAAEEAARERQQLLRATMENVPMAVAFKDLEGRFVDVNAAVEAVLGATKDLIRGRTLYDFAPSATADEFREHEIEVIRHRRPAQFEALTVAPNGTWYLLHTIFPLIDAHGQVYGTGLISQDITQRKEAEQTQREANDRLVEIDRRKSEFLAVLSHELRNPLAPIRNSVYIMERAAPGGPQAKRALAVIDRQVNHLCRLIDDLLDITRISRGKIRLQSEPIELNEIVRGAGEDVRDLFHRNGIELEVSVPDKPLCVFADRTRMGQVIGNLLQNAAKFTPKGGRTKLTLDVSKDGYAVIEVRDNGAGIDPALVGRLFQPFVQAEQTIDRNRGGLGLGLALVKGLVELHGGSVSVVSEGTGKGSVFSIRLPFEGAPQAPQTRSASMSRAPNTGHSLKALVIEDNPDSATSLKEVLELSGYEVDLAFTGPEGIERARALCPDLVVCDIGLPEVDGYGVAKILRADPKLRQTFMVALSGYALPDDVDRSKQAGFDRHMSKPPDMSALEHVLAEASASSLAN